MSSTVLSTSVVTVSPTSSAFSLPSTANSLLCDCMLSQLTCTLTTNPAPSNDTLTQIFQNTCDPNNGGIACTGLTQAYSHCSPEQQASWALNAYANAFDDCLGSFGGNEVTPVSLNSTCQGLLSQAGGVNGTGTVTSVPAAATATSMSSTSGTGGATTTTTPLPTNNIASSGISTGAKIGIGVAVGIVGLIALLGLFFLYWRMRKRQKKTKKDQKGTGREAWTKPELQGQGVERGSAGTMSGGIGGNAAELDGGDRRAEMSTNDNANRAELSG